PPLYEKQYVYVGFSCTIPGPIGPVVRISESLSKNQHLLKEIQHLKRKNPQLQAELHLKETLKFNLSMEKLSDLMVQRIHFTNPVYDCLIQAEERCNQVMQNLQQKLNTKEE
ncbi:hypothetical protein KI387_037498, partial [Taxus chinensis]